MDVGTGVWVGLGVGVGLGVVVAVGGRVEIGKGVGEGAGKTDVGAAVGRGLACTVAGVFGVDCAVGVSTGAVGVSRGTASCPRQAASTQILANSRKANTKLIVRTRRISNWNPLVAHRMKDSCHGIPVPGTASKGAR